MSLTDFIKESNRIEGIVRPIGKIEIEFYERFLALDELTVNDVADLVKKICNAKIRFHSGMNVRVGDHRPPPGGSDIPKRLDDILIKINANSITPYKAHHLYETLHPFMDGNGRSGRAIWLWHTAKHHGCGYEDIIRRIGFLHRWYYQSLSESQYR